MTHRIAKRLALGLEGMNIPTYVGIFVALKLLVSHVFDFIHISVTDESITKDLFEFRNIYEALIVIVLIAPVVETYLVQHLFFKYLIGRWPQWAIIVLSAVVFGLFHHYNVGYVLYGIASGLLLSASYAFRLRSNPFVCTALIHACYNLTGFIINQS